MSPEIPQPRRLPLFGYALLLAGSITGIWFATGFSIPTARPILEASSDPLPWFVGFGLQISQLCYQLVYPFALIGLALLAVALIRRGPPKLVSICGTAFPIYSGAVVCLSLYLSFCSGFACTVADGLRRAETFFYRTTLDRYGVLEAAQGRYEKFRETLRRESTEVKNVSEFSPEEARERVYSLVSALPKVNDRGSKRRILATLALFRQRMNGLSSDQQKLVASQAAEVGVPTKNSCGEALGWIEANLGKDGWDPLPLFKVDPHGR